MKTSRFFILLGIVALLVILLYSFFGENPKAYSQSIEDYRKEQQHIVASLPIFKNALSFPGLNYFPPKPKYRVMARLTILKTGTKRILTTSDGEEQQYMEYARAEFKLDDKTHQLLILEVAGMGPARGKLFLAFSDETSGEQTYGGGRYLEVEKKPGSQTMELDFNKAYNPYCAYSDLYSCPLPPRENILKTAIQAGEKVFSAH